MLTCPSGLQNLPDSPDLPGIADCPFLLNAKGPGGFADWEYESSSVDTASSGLSDVISLQSSDGGSPIRLDDPPTRLESLQSFTSALSPFYGAAWISGAQCPPGARVCAAAPTDDATRVASDCAAVGIRRPSHSL